ncbi:MAG: hypothetical protein V7605_696 [Acidimicrobiaceae bacterium]
MDDRAFRRTGALCAVGVAVLSVLYAVAYLGVTPADQRGTDVDKAYRSYLAHPAGVRIASICLFASGLLVGVAVVAVVRHLAPRSRSTLTWVAIAGLVGGLATAAHGLSDLLGVDKLAHTYGDGDAATRAAVVVAHAAPSAVDPRGLATFLVAGLVAFTIGVVLRPARSRLGVLGMVLGVDMVVLFIATAVGVNGLVLVTGGLASVVLGPLWWVCLARLLWSETPAVTGS